MRLQILHLPAPPDEYPFIFVLDETELAGSAQAVKAIDKKARALGAEGALVFSDTVEIV